MKTALISWFSCLTVVSFLLPLNRKLCPRQMLVLYQAFKDEKLIKISSFGGKDCHTNVQISDLNVEGLDITYCNNHSILKNISFNYQHV